MTHRILTALRRLVLPRVLKSLQVQEIATFPTEPDEAHPDRGLDADVWIFEAEPTVAHHVSELADQMDRLGGALNNLRALVSDISCDAPADAQRALAPVSGVIWSETLLFDGEPQPMMDQPLLAHDDSDFLFDNIQPIIPTAANGMTLPTCVQASMPS
ncbi:MAG: hypothetical protein AAGK23_00800 [Pseudomonadota bacterium]